MSIAVYSEQQTQQLFDLFSAMTDYYAGDPVRINHFVKVHAYARQIGLAEQLNADALFLLAKHGGGVGANTVLTPHPGEMARLCGMTTQAVLAAPVETAQQLAADLGACVLLKGATTVIAQGEDVAMNVTGCDGMGTGGCGDVLPGVIAALLAQGMSVWDAARVGAFYHGRAGEAAQKKLGARGVTAWDVCEALRIE